MRTLRNHGLSLFFFAIFVAALIGQSIAGHAEFNNDAVAHGAETYSFWRYVTSSEFGQAVMENWQSEYLQFTLFILATVWFVAEGIARSRRSSTRSGPGPTRSSRSPGAGTTSSCSSTRTRCSS